MDLSFSEKSVWGSLLGIAIASYLFFPDAINHINEGGQPIGLFGNVIFIVGVLIAVEVVYHTLVGASSDSTGSDERDALISLKADRNAGYALGFGAFWIVGLVMFADLRADTNALETSMVAIYLLLALTASEVVKLTSQLWYYRTGV